ncbi:hypothetical protein NQ317_001775 [Molorchus minor]|uniref:Glutamine amidotransferase type-2 domain-containing protein n=1 Tax=Molorchus minor TaxID=1323400 RepID=A0ABQ9JIH9_9CUCU|nr:hypothetical protein NQ317_001775 [Molorchus minor]
MCGIICILSGTIENSVNTVDIFQVFKENIANRGPDSLNVEKYSSENWDLLFGASVLWLQGKCITSQPLKDDESLFVYNGDIFGGISDHHLMRADHGDTTILFDAIKQMPMISAVLASKQGPYAFIYLDKRKQKLYFARDIFGRRSLLIGKRGRFTYTH